MLLYPDHFAEVFMYRASLMVLLLIAACSPRHSPSGSEAQPFELISMSAFPVMESNTTNKDVKLIVIFLVRRDGSIENIRLENSSGDQDWDKLALQSMYDWRFAPVDYPNGVEARWVKNLVIVQFQESVIMSIGELRTDSKVVADSLYRQLRDGADFRTLAKEASRQSEFKDWYHHNLDISTYPEHIRINIAELKPEQFTRPLRNGPHWIIYRRYE